LEFCTIVTAQPLRKGQRALMLVKLVNRLVNETRGFFANVVNRFPARAALRQRQAHFKLVVVVTPHHADETVTISLAHLISSVWHEYFEHTRVGQDVQNIRL
jgi:hypothetical protein